MGSDHETFTDGVLGKEASLCRHTLSSSYAAAPGPGLARSEPQGRALGSGDGGTMVPAALVPRGDSTPAPCSL